jgi:hypothetical protein
MFAVVLQQEHKKLSAKTPKKAKKTKLVMFYESSGSSDCYMSVDYSTVSKSDVFNSPSKKETDKRMKTRCLWPGSKIWELSLMMIDISQ